MTDRPRDPVAAKAALRAALERALAADLNVTDHRALLVLVHQILLFDRVEDAIANSVVQRLGRLDERRARRSLGRLDELGVIARTPGSSNPGARRVASRVSFETTVQHDHGVTETPGLSDPVVGNDVDPGSETTRTPGPQRPASDVLSEVLSDTTTPTVVDAAFAAFWSAYPKRNGQRLGRAKALPAWRRLSDSDRARAMDALTAYTTASNGWPKDAERYLRDRLFEDLDLDASPAASRSSSERVAAFLAQPPELEARTG